MTGDSAADADDVEVTALDDLDGTPHAAVFRSDDPRTVRLALDAGESVPEHRHPEASVVLYLLEGRMEVTVDGEAYDLSAGDIVRFDGELAVSPRALEASRALVVLAPAAE
jgi:quercetin dioxygenase-like cupin family protein